MDYKEQTRGAGLWEVDYDGLDDEWTMGWGGQRD